MTDFAAARRQMVDGQVRTADVTDLRIIAAMLDVPRERFVPAGIRGARLSRSRRAARRRPPPAQADGARQADPGRRYRPPPTACSMSAAPPATAPRCWRSLPARWWRWKRTRSLRPSRSAALGGLAKRQRWSPGRLWPDGERAAPYDVIVLEGATEIVPQALCRQLKDGGRLRLRARLRARRQGHALPPQRAMTSAGGRCSMPPPRCCPASPSRRFSHSKYLPQVFPAWQENPQTCSYSVGATPERGFNTRRPRPMVPVPRRRVGRAGVGSVRLGSRSGFECCVGIAAFGCGGVAGRCGSIAPWRRLPRRRGPTRSSRRWSRPTRTIRRSIRSAPRYARTDENVPQALSGYRPRVTVNGVGGEQSLSSTAKTSGIVPGTPTNYRTQSGYNAPYAGGRDDHADAVQRLSDRQPDARRRKARCSPRARLCAHTEQTVLLNAATAYMNLLRDTAILDLQRRNVEVLQEQLRQTRDRFNVGEVTRTDVAQSESQSRRRPLAGAHRGSQLHHLARRPIGR